MSKEVTAPVDLADERSVRNTIRLLLGAEKLKAESEQDRLDRIVAGEAAYVRFGGAAQSTQGPNYAAVHTILSRPGISKSIIDFTINELLAMWGSDRRNFDVLSEVSGFLRYRASPDVVEKVVTAFAVQGFTGRVEATAREYLGRGLLPAEVIALVDAYCEDRVCQSNDQEEQLAAMAERYLAYPDATKVRERLVRFRREFHERD
ncbi:MAG: hypothetical protein HY457_01100 [Parcubacteria group bacterium]|nr:hypothetical protein [Parcubacteria group bacterium]